MKNILYLVHRIPYPPNKGDKIRSFHFLKALAERYHVFLGTFIDDPEDEQYVDKVSEYCTGFLCLELSPVVAKIKSLTGLISGQALSLPYYQSRSMQRWVDETIETQKIEKVIIFSSVMAQFVLHKPGLDIVVDFVDVDSDKWRQYAQKKHWPASWIYQRESQQLLAFDKAVASAAKTSFFVSKQEAELFKQLVPEIKHKITAVNNGVDIEFFTPERDYPSPFADHNKVIVFTGAMDYWPNIDAVCWFARNVFPEICKLDSDAVFYIVGSKPAKDVLALAELNDKIRVTGRVEDVRPYLAHALFVVAPLRIARGIQNKVLEAMAMAKTVLATPAAMEGINGYEADHVWVSDDAGQLSKNACMLLEQSVEHLQSLSNRTFVEKEFSWSGSGEYLARLIDEKK